MTISERIADLALKVSLDTDTSELEEILRAQGATVTKESDTVIICKANYAIGISVESDPITALSVIIMALWGPHGMLLPEAKEAFDIVNKQWRERIKLAKTKKKSKTEPKKQLDLL